MMGTGACYMDLQSTLAAANPPSDMTSGHHPIACRAGMIVLEEDGRMGCEHLYVPADDPRTQGCIDQSIAVLLIELLVERETQRHR